MNKGELAEPLAATRILLDGRLDFLSPGSRSVSSVEITSVLSGNSEIRIAENGNLNRPDGTAIPRQALEEAAATLSRTMTNGIEGNETAIEKTKAFFEEVLRFPIKGSSARKDDLRLMPRNAPLSMASGYSIKGIGGSKASILNASGATGINLYFARPPFDRLPANVRPAEVLQKLGKKAENPLAESGPANRVFVGNLRQIDTTFPKTLTKTIFLFHLLGEPRLEPLIKRTIIRDDDEASETTRVRGNFIRFLEACLEGMKPATSWSGQRTADGGIILVEAGNGGDRLVAIPSQAREFLGDRLFDAASFDTPSITRHPIRPRFENDVLRITITAQIRLDLANILRRGENA
jgi:hypothetical protein